ncbi:MAG TPA: EMC3/TMCO1 family protein [Methanoregula sp.]|nr:EMC3/TMCO1 family protein [Methanoregula sp.]
MDWGKFWDKNGIWFALGFMLLMMYSYSVSWLRADIGSGMDAIFSPLVDQFRIPFYILIVILSALTGLYTSIIYKYTLDYEKMTETQERFKEFQTEYREAQLSQDEKKIRKLEAKKERLMREQLEMSQQQFKPMPYILVLTVPIFFWLLFRLNEIHTTITLPYTGTLELHAPAIWIIPAWMLWYFICSISLSQVIRKSLNIGGL